MEIVYTNCLLKNIVSTNGLLREIVSTSGLLAIIYWTRCSRMGRAKLVLLYIGPLMGGYPILVSILRMGMCPVSLGKILCPVSLKKLLKFS